MITCVHSIVHRIDNSSADCITGNTLYLNYRYSYSEFYTVIG